MVGGKKERKKKRVVIYNGNRGREKMGKEDILKVMKKKIYIYILKNRIIK